MKQQDGEDEKVTYYLTYFNVFDSEVLFQDYQGFLEKLMIHLGQDWRIESNILWDEQEDGEGYPHIFNLFLSVFLEGRINKQYSNSKVDVYDQSVDQQKAVLRYNKVKTETKNDQIKSIHKNIGQSLTFQTLSLGFFVTAWQIWQSVFSDSKDKPRHQGDLNPLAISIEQETSQTIRKLRKLSNNVSQSLRSGLQNLEFVSHSGSLFSPQQSSSKVMSKLSLFKNVTWKPFKVQESEIPMQTLSKIKKVLNSDTKCQKWQVLSNFMVNILEMKHNDQKAGKLVRIIRVCKEFYHIATAIWLLFNNKKNYSMNFAEYKGYVQEILNDKWKHNYQSALRLCFQILVKEWNQIVKEHAIDLNEDHQVMRIFIQRSRKSLLNSWSSTLSKIDLQLLQI